MHEPHDEPKDKSSAVLLLQVIECKERLWIVSEVLQFLKESIIIELQELLEMIPALLPWSARTEEVRQFVSRSAKSSNLKIQKYNRGGVKGPIFRESRERKNIIDLTNKQWSTMGSGYDTVGTAVSSDARDMQFESSHCNFICYQLY